MLRDNPEGSSSRWLSSAGGPSPALHVDGRKSSDDRPSWLENPRPARAESTLTENASSPFHAERCQLLRASNKTPLVTHGGPPVGETSALQPAAKLSARW